VQHDRSGRLEEPSKVRAAKSVDEQRAAVHAKTVKLRTWKRKRAHRRRHRGGPVSRSASGIAALSI